MSLLMDHQRRVIEYRHGALLNLKLPTNLVSSFNVDTISGVVGWTDTNAGKAEYEVYRSTNGGADTLLATTALGATSYTDTGCKQNASVVYKIKAKKGTKVSDYVVATALMTPLCMKTNQSVLGVVTFPALNMIAGKTVIVGWGDGSSTNYTGSSVPSKNYAATGQYNITLTGDVDFITHLNISSQPKLFGNLNNWILPNALVYYNVLINAFTGMGDNMTVPSTTNFYYIRNNGFTGKLPRIGANAALGLDYNVSACSFSDTDITVFRKAMTGFNISNQNVPFSTANIDKLLKALADWYQVNAPTANCTFTLSGANMGIPTGGASNADLTRLVGYYTAAGRTATVLVRTS